MDFEDEGHKDFKDVVVGLKGNLISPPSDCNSNNLMMPRESNFLCSTESLQDYPDFLQDNSDYQWFLDYGYKDNNSHHQSILFLSKSQDLGYYDDMAKNIDANLAEVDMDDFNREDIHSVLSTLPNMQGVREREMFSSVTGSMMDEQINTSICKSKLLFSPVHESYLPNGNLSIDSLDISENDINLMVTCQSNKSNYTIAFEGSTVMASDDSDCHELGGNEISGSEEMESTQSDDKYRKNHHSGEGFGVQSSSAMGSYDSTFTTWSKIRGNSSDNLQLRLHPCGNNNASSDISGSVEANGTTNGFKSLSLPNLFLQKKKDTCCMSKSAKLNQELENKSAVRNEGLCIKLFDIENNGGCKGMDESTSSSGKPPPNFSLVKLFIKQKSTSHEGMANLTTDQICKNSKACEKNQSGNCKKCKNISSQIIEMNNINAKNCVFDYASPSITSKINEEKSGELTKTSGQENLFSEASDKIIQHNCCCSDESTQENGSNTESAENITCNREGPVCDNKRKKSLSEKSIQTSKLLNNSEKERKVPVYILYPNYSLPNLEFLKKEHYVQNIDFSKIFLKPQKFHMPESSVSSSKFHSRKYEKRPFSVNDIETLKKTGFKHIRDWESLTFLLPKEYKQFLQEIPEIFTQLKDVKEPKEETVPLFCLSPPNRRIKKRPISCDANFSNDCRSSNFSSTATQPSSGFRGSSTMLYSNNSNCSKRSGSVSHNRTCSVGSDDSNDIPPPRPPLPKSILRNNSLDNQHYSCKTQKEYANKRFSMIELGDKNLILEEKLSGRHLNNSKLPQASVTRNHEQFESEAEKISRHPEARGQGGKSHLEMDMKRLEELLGISAVFGESVESFTERDMMRLRSQVSKFLTMQKNLEKVSETLQTVDEAKTNESLSNASANSHEEGHFLGVKNINTPHNTPEHKNQAGKNRTRDLSGLLAEDYLKPCECNGQVHEFERGDCKFNEENLCSLKKTVSFAEKISFNVKEYERSKERTPPNSPSFALNSQKQNLVKLKRPVDLPICEESVESLKNDSPVAQYLQSSSELIHKRDLILDVKNSVEKILKLCSETPGDPANICLHHLCPSLYAVLSDGLKEEIDTPFGPIRNSVWSVIEASSQQGPMTHTLNELVQRLNRDDIFTEGLIKFNAFIFGLLNARALSGWFSYLRTRDSLLRKYYSSCGLFLLSNTAGAPFRVLVDQLINIIEPLCSLQFNLDLMYQTKLLHCSLQNLNSLLEEPSNNDFLTPTKQFMLLKLVQSIQNSISQSGEGKRGKHTLEDIEQKTSDPPVDHLLEKNKSIRTRRTGDKARPRSGCDTVGAEEATDVASAMKKRWSGVNLSSKLVEAFDRLVDDSESDYTDSLDIVAPLAQERTSPTKKCEKRKVFAGSEADSYTKEQRKNILLNLNKKSGKVDYKTDSKNKELMDHSTNRAQSGGGLKFNRLQQKWEKLSRRSASDSDSDNRSPTEKMVARKTVSSKKFEKSSSETNIPATSPSTKVSKIPRLVTSPLSSAPTIKTTGHVKKLVSPTSLEKAKQRGGSYNNVSRGISPDGKVIPTFGHRLSRCDEKTEPSHSVTAGKTHIARPTSLPYRDVSALPVKNTEPISRRAASLNRKPGAKKLQQAQRSVRTLTHRLPSDSGHLSFNKGERLKVVLEVDKTWLLCCRGTQKGLVPKSAVISELEENKF